MRIPPPETSPPERRLSLRRDAPPPAGEHGWLLPIVVAAVAGCASVPAADEQVPLGPGGDPARGREVFVSRDGGHCVLCHSVPGSTVAGNIGPPLAGVGSRLTAAQIRFRVVDITRLNPGAVMPAFHRTEGLVRVPAPYAGRPVLGAQQVEDVVAFLAGLR